MNLIKQFLEWWPMGRHVPTPPPRLTFEPKPESAGITAENIRTLRRVMQAEGVPTLNGGTGVPPEPNWEGGREAVQRSRERIELRDQNGDVAAVVFPDGTRIGELEGRHDDMVDATALAFDAARMMNTIDRVAKEIETVAMVDAPRRRMLDVVKPELPDPWCDAEKVREETFRQPATDTPLERTVTERAISSQAWSTMSASYSTMITSRSIPWSEQIYQETFGAREQPAVMPLGNLRRDGEGNLWVGDGRTAGGLLVSNLTAVGVNSIYNSVREDLGNEVAERLHHDMMRDIHGVDGGQTEAEIEGAEDRSYLFIGGYLNGRRQVVPRMRGEFHVARADRLPSANYEMEDRLPTVRTDAYRKRRFEFTSAEGMTRVVWVYVLTSLSEEELSRMIIAQLSREDRGE